MHNLKQFYEWGIIGGGPHGLALAGALMKTGLYTSRDLVIVDSGPAPLWAWRKRVANCGMRHMRSDVRYHLDCWPQSSAYTLNEWADQDWPLDRHIFVLDEATNHRVASVALFDAHCNWFIGRHNLEQAWCQGYVQRLLRHPSQSLWQVHLASGAIINARRIVLATGSGKLNYPLWTRSLNSVYHLLDLTAAEPEWQNLKHLTVIGAGLSSANFILNLYRNPSPIPQITLLKRSPFKTSVLEADLNTLGPAFQNQFSQSDYSTRRKLISQARVNGSVPPQTQQKLLNTDLQIIQAEVQAARESQGGLELHLNNGEQLQTQAVVLGTGFAKGTEQYPLVYQLAEDYKLPLSECGYPMPASNLEWLDGLYLMGGAAELELGPVSRNLAGAGQSVARILNEVLPK